jgi:hypothetical protein
MAKPAIIEHNDNRHNSIRGEVLLLRAVMQQTSKYIKWKFQQLYCTMKQTGDLFSHHQKSGKPNSAPTLYSGDEAPSAHNGDLHHPVATEPLKVMNCSIIHK